MNRLRRGSLRCSASTVLVSIAALVACGSDGPQRPDPADDAAIYSALVSEFAPELPAQDPDVRPVVYVVGFGDPPPSLETQIAVIEGFADTNDVRFVDDRTAAIDDALDNAPARDGGVLIGIGQVSAESPQVVRVEVYRDRDQHHAHLATVARRDGSWIVTADEPVDPEALVDSGG